MSHETTNFPIMLETIPENGKLRVLFDSSLYKQSGCLRRLYYILVRGCRDTRKSFKLEYGTAGHKALAHLYSGGTLQESITLAMEHYAQSDIYVPETDWRQTSHLLNTLFQYNEQVFKYDNLKPVKINGQPLVEHRFLIPFWSSDIAEYCLCGTVDMIADIGLGVNIVVDHKFTALTQVDSFMAEYCLSPQLMVYTMIIRKLFPEMGETGAMINGIFLNKTGKNTFKRSEVFFYTQEQLESLHINIHQTMVAFNTSLDYYLNESHPRSKEKYFVQNFTCCSEKWGMCDFTPACCAKPEHREIVLEQDYKFVGYNPLTHQL